MYSVYDLSYVPMRSALDSAVCSTARDLLIGWLQSLRGRPVYVIGSIYEAFIPQTSLQNVGGVPEECRRTAGWMPEGYRRDAGGSLRDVEGCRGMSEGCRTEERKPNGSRTDVRGCRTNVVGMSEGRRRDESYMNAS